MAFPKRLKPLMLILLWVCIMFYILISFDKEITDEEVHEEEKAATDEKIVPSSQLSILEIRERIEHLNKQQYIQYERIFEPLRQDSPVIVIEVHNQFSHLKRIIDSLALANGIEKALLIFSHDFYDDKINSLVKNIDFCKTLQIFYPYSLQTHPNSFPGPSPEDCPHDIGSNVAIAINCSNALHPDQYGRYRDATLTQSKHHWWWTTNHVFNWLNITENFHGWVIFLEDNDYVATPDFVHSLRLMRNARQSHCPKCEILYLGSRGSVADVDFRLHSKHAEIAPWRDNNIGMAFCRSLWEKIKTCARIFCTYDDYKYDRSLLGVSKKCLENEVATVVLRAPRVFRFEDCDSCDRSSGLLDLQTKVNASMVYLFPDKLLLTRVNYTNSKELTMNGGWSDTRDHELCLEITKSKN